MLERGVIWQRLAEDESILIDTRIISNGITYDDVLAPAVTRALMPDSVSVGNAVSGMCTFSLDSSVSLPRSAEIKMEMRLTNGEDAPDDIIDMFPVNTVSGDVVTIDDATEDVPAMLDTSVTIEPVQSGSGTPSPENVRPISGWDGVKVTRCGKNLLPTISSTTSLNGVTWTLNADGTITVNGTATSNSVIDLGRNVLTLPAGTYTTNLAETGYPDVNVFRLVNGSGVIHAAGGGTFTLTQESSVFVRFAVLAGRAMNNVTIKPMLEIGSLATAYEPYDGEVYSISLPSEAGTVYGGTLDVTTGLLTVDRAARTFDGTEPWAVHGGIASWFYVDNALPSAAIDNSASDFAISNEYTQYQYSDVANIGNGRFAIGAPDDILLRTVFKDTRFATVQQWKAALAESNIQLVYKLAAPVTYRLDPVTVSMLQGTNNIWADAGDVTVEYRTDPETGRIQTSEWLPVGTFYLSRRTKDPINGIVAFECYDAMLKANSPWNTDGITFPVAMDVAATHIATLIGVEIDERTVIATGANYTIDEPTDETLMRDVLATIAGYNGGNWIITPENKLRLVPLLDAADAEEAEDDVLDVTAAMGEVIAENMGTITGIRCNYGDDLNFLVGNDEGVVVDANVPAIIATELGETLIGKSYQTFVLNEAFYDPAVELGDYIRYYDNISSVVYTETITFDGAAQGTLSAPDSQEMADEYPYYGQTQKTLAVAKAYAEQATQVLSESLTQQEIFNRLTRGGEEQGLILVNGRLYVNASYIATGEFDAAKARIKNLSVEDIESGIIHSSDYQTVVVPMVYPSNTLYPANDTYPSNGESVTTGFAIDFETGQILGALYSTETERLQREIDNITLNSLGVNWVKVSGTTNSSGVLGLGLAKNRYMVMGVWADTTGSSYIVTPFVTQSGTNWSGYVESMGHSAIVNTSVTLYVGYVDFGAGAIS